MAFPRGAGRASYLKPRLSNLIFTTLCSWKLCTPPTLEGYAFIVNCPLSAENAG